MKTLPVLYPTVALSDLVFVIATCYSLKINWNHNIFAMIAFVLMIVAASLGVLRFGIDTKFAPHHDLATALSKYIGFPMLSLAVAFCAFERRNKAFSYCVDVVILLVLWYICEKKYKVKYYETALYGVAMVILVYTGVLNYDLYVLVATVLYVVGGLVMGGSLKPGPLGMLKVNWFHYFISVANVLFGLSLVGCELLE